MSKNGSMGNHNFHLRGARRLGVLCQRACERVRRVILVFISISFRCSRISRLGAGEIMNRVQLVCRWLTLFHRIKVVKGSGSGGGRDGNEFLCVRRALDSGSVPHRCSTSSLGCRTFFTNFSPLISKLRTSVPSPSHLRSHSFSCPVAAARISQPISLQ